MPWLDRSVGYRVANAELSATEFLAVYEMNAPLHHKRVRGGWYSLWQLPCVPFELFLQWRFGNSHLALTWIAWGFGYLGWYLFSYMPDTTNDPFAFWPMAGLAVAVLSWLQIMVGALEGSAYRLFDDLTRIEGSGCSILWDALMFVLSIFVKRLRGPVRYPALRGTWYRALDHLVTFIGHWIIWWYVVDYLFETRPHPEWLSTTVRICLYYYAARNAFFLLIVAARGAGLQSKQSMIIQMQSLAQKNLEMIDEHRANQQADAARAELLQERQERRAIPSAPPSRVVVATVTPAEPQSQYCGGCGGEIQGTKFCTSCGRKVGAES